MKSRNSSNLHRLSLKYSDSDVRDVPQRNRRKPTNFSFIEKGAQIVQHYGALLKKIPYQFGDAEAYFKQTLRNYDDFDFRSLKFDSRTNLRNHRSLDNIKVSEKRKSHLGSGDSKGKSKTQLKLNRKKSTPSISSKPKSKPDEDELDIFYSPSSQLTGEKSPNMGEEGEETPFISDMMEESEMEEASPESAAPESTAQDDTATEDPLAETEQLVQQATEDLDKLEEENAVSGGEMMSSEPEGIDEKFEMTPIEDLMAVPMGDQPKVSPKPSAGKPLDTVPEMPEPSGKPTTENAILKEVAEAEAQCAEISAILVELRQRVAVLLSKPQRSPEEDRELEEKQRQLNEKMQLLEQKTKKVEMLMTRSKGQDFDQPQTEDALPKVII
ncbi:hypothetical protein QE152_g18167 [Popillia japonica]|uniref:Uncharacterized protein n=1 Tax=Popillia japonica TaxID=7064 RepID=A0AAW1L364_POPJA